MKINYVSQDKYLQYLPLIDKAYQSAEQVLNLPQNLELNITFFTKRAIKKLNKKARNINKVTDVLSFPNITRSQTLDKLFKTQTFDEDVNPESKNIMLGDIVLCFSRIKKQARIYKSGLKRELSYMSVHGLLHLLGYDHIQDSQKKVMRKKEEEILSKLDI